MIPPQLRIVLRWLLLLAALILMTVLFANRDPVPFKTLLAVLPFACLLAIVLFRRSVHGKVESERQARVDTEDRLEEIVRLNAELSQELLESRVLDETHLLQVKAFDAFLQGVIITDPTRADNPIVYVNAGFTNMTGYEREEVLGRNCRLLQGKDTCKEATATIRQAIRAAQPCSVEIQNYRKDGTPFWNSLSLAPIFEDDHLTHFVGVQTDITAAKQLEYQLRQSQKMEAIGHLAGGVAHDFNNLLTVINGCCELLQTTTRLPKDATPLVAEIQKAGDRATTLTRQLLAFGRKAVVQTRVLSLNGLIKDFEKLLLRLIGEDIQLTTALCADAPLVRVDAGQIEQVLMNLVVNARDAMPKGGRIGISTREVYLDDEFVRQHADLRAGKYVLLSVADTGCGMDAATLARIFEPFFTTKPVGKGTGLGLAMVYGVMKSSGGHAAVESEPGRGTTFHLFLPTIVEPNAKVALPKPTGKETVLLVEDEAGVRTLTKQALEAGGYRVLEASDGQVALRLCRQHANDIDLLLSDVVMPEMGGHELGQQVARLSPQARVLFTSGYGEEAFPDPYKSDADVIQKPFSVNMLLRKVREVLDRSVPDSQLVGSKA